VLVILPWWLADAHTQAAWTPVVLGYVVLIIGVALWERHRVKRWWPMVNTLLADVLEHTPELGYKMTSCQTATNATNPSMPVLS
jgi:hypothetical protein